ncbi:MAG: hypothetical protein J3K34DRAFT_474834 [Monoraphidium minutum]|nr:MAG: hypothetical protein J3K34DRAFT_474834 [Monoraphidium minutum]
MAGGACLLPGSVATPAAALAPMLRDASERQGPMGRAYVLVQDAGDCADASLLEWLGQLYGLVGDVAPRLDVIPLLPFAGWDQDAVDALGADTLSLEGGAPGPGSAAADSSGASASAPPSAAGRGAAAAAEAVAEAAAAASAGPLAFQHVAVGGTFDRLHAGHRLLLAATALTATQTVYVGVTADELLAKKAYHDLLQPLAERTAAAAAFMATVRPGLRVESGALRDPAEPTAAELDPKMQALVVSRETLGGGDAINRGRGGRGHAPLRLVVVGLVGGRADGGKLSSTALREQDAAAARRGPG